MRPIKFLIPGEPIAQPRPRFTVRGGAPVPYKDIDHPVHGWKSLIAGIARFAMGRRSPLDEPLACALLFVMAGPKGKRPFWQWKPTKPDVDNLTKAVFDAVKGIVFKDDNVIVHTTQLKALATDSVRPGLYVVFRPAGDAVRAVEEFMSFHARS